MDILIDKKIDALKDEMQELRLLKHEIRRSIISDMDESKGKEEPNVNGG